MAYYDVVRSGMANTLDIFKRLGFKGVAVEGRDFDFSKDPGSANRKAVVYSSKSENLVPYFKNGASAIIPQNPEVLGEMRKYVNEMQDYGTSFIIDASAIENAYGTYRALLIGKFRDCTGIMLGRGIRVGIASLARNNMEVLAPVQLIAICKALGIETNDAKKALSENRSIISKL
ncbi:MAG: hypothetical protein QW814_00225 [Methanothrix sp.]